MKRSLFITGLCFLLGLPAAAQNPVNHDQPQDFTINSALFPVYGLNAVPIAGASISLVGNPGPATWCYWASANYQIGNVLSPLGCIYNAPNILTSSNYVSITPYAYPPGVVTVDILATTTNVAPTGACNCAVATGLTSGGANQESDTLSSYTVSIVNPASYSLVVRNEVVGSDSAHLLLRNASTLALVCDLSTGCGSGSGGTVTNFTAGNLSPLFTTSVATGSTTPALTFSLSNAAAGTVFGNPTGSSAAPSFTTNPVVTGLTLSGISGSTQCLHVSSAGLVSGTGSDCGTGSGGITGSGTAGNFAYFTGTTAIGNALGTTDGSTFDKFGTTSNYLEIQPGPQNLVAKMFGSSQTCAGTATMPGVTPGCALYTGVAIPQSTSTSAVTAGVWSEVENNTVTTPALQIGGLFSSQNNGATIAQSIGGYFESYSPGGVGGNTTNRGIFSLAQSSAGGPTNLNEGGVFQSGGTGGTTADDWTVHILAPISGATLTNHAGLEIDTQGTGDAILTGSDPVVFGSLAGSGTNCVQASSTGQLGLASGACGTGGGFPSTTQGNTAVVGLSAGTAVANEFHSAAFTSPTFTSMVQLCQAITPTPCHLILDPSTTALTVPLAVNTTTSAAITSTGSQSVAVGSTAGMVVGMPLWFFGSDNNKERALITAIGSGTVTATFTLTHVSGSNVTAGAVYGSTTQNVIVENNGVSLQCVGTTYSDCVVQGDFGSMTCRGKSGATNGCNFTSSAGWVGSSLFTNNGHDGVNQTDFNLDGFNFQPNASGSCDRAEVWLVAIEGKGHLDNSGGLSTAGCLIGVSIEDGPVSGSMNNFNLRNVAFYENGVTGAISYQVVSGTGTGSGSNITFDGVNGADGAENSGCADGNGCMMNIDGSAAFNTTTNTYQTGQVAHFLQSITVNHAYWESTSSTTGTSQGVEIKNVKNFNGDGWTFNGGHVFTDCVIILTPYTSSIYTQDIKFNEWIHSTVCTNAVVNQITGETITAAAQPILEYNYPGTASQNPTGPFVDGPLTVTGALTTDVTGTANNCLQANTLGVVSGTGSACGSGSSGLSGMTALGIPIAATATTVTSSTTAGTNQGQYVIGRTNTTQGTATSPTEFQSGACTDTINGTTSTFTVPYSDAYPCIIVHDRASSTAVTITLPTPTTLNNSAATFIYQNDSSVSDTLTPTTYTIALGHGAAASTLTIPSNVKCSIFLDPHNASTWDAACAPNSTSNLGTVTSVATGGIATGGPITNAGTVTVAGSGNTTTAATANSNLAAAPNDDVLIADGSGNVKDSGTLLSSLGGAVLWSGIGNAAGNLTLANGANTTTFDQTSNVAWDWANTTTATSSTTNASPTLNIAANYWTGSASAVDTWTVGSSLAAGTNGISTLTFTHSGSSGVPVISIPGGSTGLCSLCFSGSTYTGFSGTGGNLRAEVAANSGMGFFEGSTTQQGYIGGDIGGITASFGVTTGNGNAMLFESGLTATTTAAEAFDFFNANALAATSGTQTDWAEAATFDPASGSANFIMHEINPTINQTSTSSGSYTGILLNAIETSLKGSANKFLTMQGGTTGGTTKFEINNSGIIDNYNALTGAGLGVCYIVDSVSQSSQTGAATLFSFTPPSTVGGYKAHIVISVSAASSATLGWTMTWTDSNGNAQTPTNLALTQAGAIPALTYTTSAAGDYYGDAYVDVNNGGATIAVKTTFSGTSIAYKASATLCEQQ